MDRDQLARSTRSGSSTGWCARASWCASPRAQPI